jgi:hypothetical protein
MLLKIALWRMAQGGVVLRNSGRAAEDGTAQEWGAAEDDAADEGAMEEVVNLGIPSQHFGGKASSK